MVTTNQNKAPLTHIPLLKPTALQKGGTIAIVSPAAPTPQIADQECPFEIGLTFIESLGFKAKLMPNAKKAMLYLAGTDEERLSDLHDAFTDPEVDAILCARGGYGCMRLLPHLDFELIKRNPKILAGFSDVTALLLPLYKQLGLVGFYAPMLTSNLIHDEPFSQASFFTQITPTANPNQPMLIPNLDEYHCFKRGLAKAPLIGGNLSLMTALCGTPFQPETQGHILFLEDWKESFYTLDRKFQQLKLAGLFDDLKGLILCDFSQIDCLPEKSLPEFLSWITTDLNCPVGFGFSIGHGEQTGTLPIGVHCQFNSELGELTLLESGVHG